MSAADQSEPQPLGAVIYLSTNRPLRLADFMAEFRKTWPLGLLEKTGKGLHAASFRSGKSDFTIEMHHEPVPQSVTDRVARHTLHWPLAEQALANHPAHLAVNSVTTSHCWLTLACDLTRAIAALVPVTDSLAVCWLNGPALNPAKTFVATVREMFETGLYPINLWVAARFDPAAGTLSTQGLTQFAAPEISLTHQPDTAPLMVDYLFQVAHYVLTSHHKIKDGEKMASPNGILKIRAESSPKGRKTLILDPAD
jgi:hypothetical protein